MDFFLLGNLNPAHVLPYLWVRHIIWRPPPMRIGQFTTRLILTVSLLLLVGVVGISVGVYYFGKQLIE